MRIRRHEGDVESLDFPYWPVLVDAPIARTEFYWLDRHEHTEPWKFWAQAKGVPVEGTPACNFLVELRAEDVGEILASLPAEAVGAVLDRLLRDGDPEVIGAFVGRIVTHLARGIPKAPKPTGDHAEPGAAAEGGGT
jgi:hypothetical protein